MRHSKYVKVPDLSEHHYVSLPLRELFPFWRYEWFRSNTVLSVFASSLKASGQHIVAVRWIEQSSLELLMGDINLSNLASVQLVNLIFRDYVARWQVKFLTHWRNICIDSPPQMFCWSSSDVRYMNRDTDWLTLHKRRIGIITEFQPRPLLDHILPLGVHKTLLGGASGIPSGIRRFVEFWILPNDLSELTLHHNELAVVNASNVKSDENRTNFEDDFPRWRLIGLAVGSFVMTIYGWWYLRNEVRIAWGFCWWCVGVALWVYTVNVWIVHTVTP